MLEKLDPKFYYLQNSRFVLQIQSMISDVTIGFGLAKKQRHGVEIADLLADLVNFCTAQRTDTISAGLNSIGQN